MHKQGRKSPLETMPVTEFSYPWYMDAYSMLISSGNQNGIVPLSEILAYTKCFDLIGSQREFIKVIQSLDEHNYAQKVKLQKSKEAREKIKIKGK